MGKIFPDRIRAGIDAAKVVLVVIGPGWLETLNTRVSQPCVDYIRAEVTQALIRVATTPAMKVIPVLMSGTKKSLANQLELPLRNELQGLYTANEHTLLGLPANRSPGQS